MINKSPALPSAEIFEDSQCSPQLFCKPRLHRQTYTQDGRLVAPRNRENLDVEKFVVVFCDEEPVICVVKELEVTEDYFKIHYWEGTYKGRWSPLTSSSSIERWTQILPKQCSLRAGSPWSTERAREIERRSCGTRKFLGTSSPDSFPADRFSLRHSRG